MEFLCQVKCDRNARVEIHVFNDFEKLKTHFGHYPDLQMGKQKKCFIRKRVAKLVIWGKLSCFSCYHWIIHLSHFLKHKWNKCFLRERAAKLAIWGKISFLLFMLFTGLFISVTFLHTGINKQVIWHSKNLWPAIQLSYAQTIPLGLSDVTEPDSHHYNRIIWFFFF